MLHNLPANVGPRGYDPQRSFQADLCNDLMTVAELAALLKLPVSWVYERTRRRGLEQIPHFKLGKYLRFSEREIVDWLQKARGI